MWIFPDNWIPSFLDIESSPASRSALQSTLPGGNPFEELRADGEEEEEEGFLEPEIPFQVSEADREGDSFDVFPSRADEALKTRKCIEFIVYKHITIKIELLIISCFLSGCIKTSPGEPVDVPGICTANQTFHRSPSPQDHLFEDPDR